MRLSFFLCLALAACSSDPTDGNPPPPQDVQPFDLAPDATDAQRVDVGGDRPGPMGAGADAGFDVGFEAAAQEIPGPDVADAGGDVAGDQPADVADARVNCAAATSVPCRTSIECAADCLPPTQIDAMRWCCIGGGEFGECGVSANANCTRP